MSTGLRPPAPCVNASKPITPGAYVTLGEARALLILHMPGKWTNRNVREFLLCHRDGVDKGDSPGQRYDPVLFCLPCLYVQVDRHKARRARRGRLKQLGLPIRGVVIMDELHG